MENNIPQADTRQALIEQAFNCDWPEYHQLLNQLSAGYQLPSCLKLLNNADQLLNQDADLANSEDAERFLIGGVEDKLTQKKYPFDSQLLGEMNGFASFKKLLKTDPKGLDKLMRILPKTGPIDGWHYLQFVDGYKNWFTENGFKQTILFPITRLLAMKRPDHFVPLNEKTAQLLCDSLSIKPLKKQDYQRYWDDIILTIHNTKWFKMFQPMDPAELPFHRVRVALLERLAIVPLSDDAIIEQVSTADENQQPITKTNEPTTMTENPVPSVTEETITPTSTEKMSANPFIRNEIPKESTKLVKQPKKLTIEKKQSAKVNQNAATKLMSQYYFANKADFKKIDMAKHRKNIIERLIAGESVEDIFENLV